MTDATLSLTGRAALPLMSAAALPLMSAATPPLVAENLSVRLGRQQALDGLSLQVQAGAWCAIVGPNGAGKSTLLSVLAGLRRPDEGHVSLHGRAIAQWPVRERAKQLSWLSQQGEADGEIPVLDVVRLGRLPHQGLFGRLGPDDEAAVQQAMADTECTAFAQRRLNELSGGERQRVLLARALAVQAPLLLLDEPTTHLDAPHQRALLRSLRAQVQRGAAVLSVLHDLNLALAADRLLVMQQGRVVADGSADDAAVRQQLVQVFDAAFSIEQITRDGHARWVALPSL